MQRMSALDASFLEVEDAVTHMHIGSVAIFEGPPPRYEALRGMVLGKPAAGPALPPDRALRRVQSGPPGVGRRPHFNLDYHLRRTALPAPGGERELRNLVGRVMSQQLDRAKPLWEMWIVEGLDEGRWALLSKVHHCMVDGVSGTDLLTVILDREPAAAPPDEGRVAAAGRPHPAELLARALAP